MFSILLFLDDPIRYFFIYYPVGIYTTSSINSSSVPEAGWRSKEET
jgi:hypothetical protein